jgi:hypothetical protein
MNGHVDSTTPEAHTFLTLNARYQIAPGATTDDLLNDATCLLEGAYTFALDIANELDRPQLHTLTYLIQMAKNAVNEGHRQFLTTTRGAR